jgi:hypothetical protein
MGDIALAPEEKDSGSPLLLQVRNDTFVFILHLIQDRP